MSIKYSIKNIVKIGKEISGGEYDVTVSANRNNQGDMTFTVRLQDITKDSIDIESIARLALLLFKSGVPLATLKSTTYQPMVN